MTTPLPHDLLMRERDHYINMVFKLIPYRQEKYEHLDAYFNSVVRHLAGFKLLSMHDEKIVDVIGLVEYARTIEDFSEYKTVIFDACGLLKTLKWGDVDD